MICFFFTVYGIDLFVWKRHGVNYRSILGVKHEHNYHFIVRAAIGLVSIVFMSFMLFVLSLTEQIHSNKNIWPLAAISCCLLYLLSPLDWMPQWNGRDQRYAFLRMLFSTLMAPFSETT